MSTFSGKLEEVPHISIDRFDGENLYSKAYLLSHCHTDHMKGLEALTFQDKLIKNNEFLYASPVSCIILKRMYPSIKNQLKELCLHSATSIFVRDQYIISVYPISAGHCPGSVMFLIENAGKRILYTGDYRINPSDFKKLKPFYDSFNNLKTIDKLYLDTTFFLQSYPRFPTRQESLNELCRIISEWTSQNDNKIIHLLTPARYGQEYIFSGIFKKLKMPVHINSENYKFYSMIPEMDRAVTTEGSVTKIHCSCGNHFREICQQSESWNIRKIKPSALRWKEENLVEGLSNSDKGVHYVCYSSHASYEEGLKLIEFLKPKEIEPCVEQEDPVENKKMYQLINEKLKEIHTKDEKYNENLKLFDISAQTEEDSTDSSILLSSQGSAKSECCDIFDSPPKKVPKFFEDSLLDSPPR